MYWLVFLILFYLILLAFCVLAYVFQSLSMYTIAKRRGIQHPWLAWIPVGCNWLLGCISDQYQYVAKGKEKSKRKVLLALSIVSMILSIAIAVCYVWVISEMAISLVSLFSLGENYDFSDLIATSATPLAVISACSLFSSIFSITAMVFQYMAMYDLYRSCDPDNSVLFLILSIFISVAQPFLFFACRNQDSGMPPRRDQAPAESPVWQPPAPAQEPWEQNRNT